MERWQNKFHYNQIPTLLALQNKAIEYFVRRDLLNENVGSVEILWELPVAKKLINRQKENGAWKYPSGKKHLRSQENYNQLETFRNLGFLVEKYGFNRNHSSIQKAAEYLFTGQTDEGDFRGIYGTQYATTYHSAIMELLIKAGYHHDPHIEKGFTWLLSMRQHDGGWAIPLRTVKMNYIDALKKRNTIQPDRSKPFSHLITGMVLRAFAAHPQYRTSKDAKTAGDLLVSRFFKKDTYPDRGTREYWMKFSYPFWFTDFLSSLDSLSYLGFTKEKPQIRSALDWFVEKQQKNGLFNVKLLQGKDKDLPCWLCLAISRVFKRYYHD